MFLPRLAPRFDVALRDVAAERPEFRLDAARVLASAATEPERSRARVALRPLLDDAHVRVRLAAIEALGLLGTDEELPALARRLRDPSNAIREAAVVAIARIGTEAAREALRPLVDADAPEIRYQAVESLGTLVDHESASTIARRLGDEDRFVREAAASALEVLGAANHREALVERLRDDDASVRVAAALALASLDDRRSLPELVANVRLGRATLEVLDALVRMPSDESLEALRSLLRRRFGVPARQRLAIGATLAALADAEGEEVVRSALRSFFLGRRLEALAFVARHRLVALADDVALFARRPRGVPRDVLLHTLERLETSERARETITFLERDERTP